MAIRTTVKLLIDSVLAAASPYVGGMSARVEADSVYPSGTADNQADKVHQSSRSLATGANETVDLTTITDPAGAALSLAEVVILVIESSSSNTTALTIEGGASNPWTALLASGALTLKPGGKLVLVAPKDGSYAVSGSSKTLKFTNGSGATAAFTLTVIGRSA